MEQLVFLWFWQLSLLWDPRRGEKTWIRLSREVWIRIFFQGIVKIPVIRTFSDRERNTQKMRGLFPYGKIRQRFSFIRMLPDRRSFFPEEKGILHLQKAMRKTPILKALLQGSRERSLCFRHRILWRESRSSQHCFRRGMLRRKKKRTMPTVRHPFCPWQARSSCL